MSYKFFFIIFLFPFTLNVHNITPGKHEEKSYKTRLGDILQTIWLLFLKRVTLKKTMKGREIVTKQRRLGDMTTKCNIVP